MQDSKYQKMEEKDTKLENKLVFFFSFHFLHHCLLCIHVCRKMAEFHGDGDLQSGGDAVDAFTFFKKR